MLFSKKYYPVFLLLIVLFSFGWGLSSAPLFDEDEGFFAEGTREMVLRGDFVSSYVNQEARYDKPPLTNWLQYLSTWLLGWGEAAMRLPSAIAAVGWMGAIYLYTRKKIGTEAAFFATLMATCSLQITIIGKAALADSLLNACLAAAMFSLYELLTSGRYGWAFYALTGIGFLTKGPIAVLVPGAVTVLYLLRWWDWRPLLRLINPLGILLFLLIALPWYILQYIQLGDEFIEGFFMNHNINRFQTAFEGHYGGILYFVPVLLVGLMPFTGVVLKVFGKSRYLWNDRFFSFHLLWFVFVFVFFSLSGTKLHHYVICGYTPLFIMAGWYASQSSRLPLWPLLILLLLLTIIPFIIPAIIPLVQDAYAVEVIKGAAEQFDVFYLISMILLIIITLVASFKHTWPKDIRMGICGIVLLVTINILWMPRLGALLQEPVKEAALLAKELKPERLVVNDHYNPSFHYYSGLYAEERDTQPGDVVFTKKHRLTDFPKKEILYEKYGLVLARIGK
jgi:4-amino-4-deoxy-L-arabinose transferase-like glycosyltransferase